MKHACSTGGLQRGSDKCSAAIHITQKHKKLTQKCSQVMIKLISNNSKPTNMHMICFVITEEHQPHSYQRKAQKSELAVHGLLQNAFKRAACECLTELPAVRSGPH